MRRWLTLAALCVFAPHATAGDSKPALDMWEAAYLEGGKAGYVQTRVEEHEEGGKKFYITVVSLRLTVKRFDQVIQLRMDTGTTETAQGNVLGTFMRQYLGEKVAREIRGVIKGNELQLSAGKEPLKSVPWKDGVVGLYRQQTMFRDRAVKPGDSYEYLSFEPSLSIIVPMKVQVKEQEDVEVFGGKKKRLLRVETKPAKVQNIQLPTLVTWVDDRFTPLRSQTAVPGLGTIVLYRTTRELALAPGPTATLTDIGIGQFIRLKQRITSPYQAKAALYRITLKKDDDPGTSFSRDERQTIKNLKGQTFELEVRASKGPQAGKEEKAKAEFAQSSYFIKSDDATVKQHAREAVGGETDAWKKALRIEQWVHGKMSAASHEALAPADHVARTLQGDCTEFAMLAAAMCRAEGVPSRTAVGLIYAEQKNGPVFAFHMWFEVWINGRWIPLDATLGKGYVGATHLKIADQSWHDERSLAPLLPVVRVVGQVAIEIVSAE